MDAIVAAAVPFQFQYGAIWSGIITVIDEQTDLVSIPVWCDLE